METLNDIGAKAITAGTDYEFSEAFFAWQDALPIAWSVPDGVIPLNAAAAVAALLSTGLTVEEQTCAVATAKLRLRGRREHMSLGGVSVVMDVAHNPDATFQLHEFLKTLPQVEHTIAVFAVMSDKDCRDMIDTLESDVDFWCLPSGIGGERGEDPVKLSVYLGENSRVFETFDESLEYALDFLNGVGRLLVFGSFFTVAAAIQALRVRAAGDQGLNNV